MDRQLPSDIEAERATLGAILLNREAIVAVDGWLEPEHFYLEKHSWIYEAMRQCYRNRVPPDISTVSTELRRVERLDSCGGLMYLVDLANSVPTAVHVEFYAKVVSDCASLRNLIMVGGTIAALGFDERDDVEATLDKAEQALFKATQRTTTTNFTSISQLADTYYEKLQAMREQAKTGQIVGVTTGYTDLDEVTGGLHKSDLIIIAGRPGTGKTSLALCLAYNSALKAAAKVGIFELEMSGEQLLQRNLSMYTGIDVQRLRTGNIRDTDLQTLMEALGHVSQLQININDIAGLTIADIRSKARRLKAEQGLDLLIIDYLQLIQGRGGRSGENRVQEVSEISRGLKLLARELDIPIIALSQLSRDVEKRGGSHVPMLSDLRESGSLEQDADIVMFIYREELYDKETDKKGIAEIHIAKHRNGPTAVVPLRFDANTTSFQNLEMYRSVEGY